VGGKIYAIGGLWDETIVEVYDPVTNKWTKKPNITIGRWGLSASLVGGKIYAIGGFDGLSIVEEYDTGFVDEGKEGLEAKGKLATTWAALKK